MSRFISLTREVKVSADEQARLLVMRSRRKKASSFDRICERFSNTGYYNKGRLLIGIGSAIVIFSGSQAAAP
jgi:hypothetical protein